MASVCSTVPTHKGRREGGREGEREGERGRKLDQATFVRSDHVDRDYSEGVYLHVCLVSQLGTSIKHRYYQHRL